MRFSFLIITFTFLISCQKNKCESFREENFLFDTILPHPYFPAFPGSYWIFNDTSLHTITVEPNWSPFKLIEQQEKNGCESLVTAMVMLPKIGSDYLFYDRLLTPFNNEYVEENILFSDELYWKSYTHPEYFYPSPPNYWNTNPYPDKYKYYRTRIDFLTNVEFNTMFFDTVMVIKEDQYLTGGVHENFLLYTNIYYYAKDVGPIRIEMYETNQGQSPVPIILNLTDYFINN